MTRAKGKQLLSLSSQVKDTAAFRGVKLVMPECHVPVQQNFQGHVFTEFTTGPCQMAVKDDPALAFTWFKTCTHGPEMDSQGAPIPEEMRCYYEVAMTSERKPKIVEGGAVAEWQDVTRYEVRPRIRDVAWNERLMSGFAVRYSQQRGAKPIEDFDIAPFCEMYGCNRQKSLKQFKNGLFCSPTHAKMVKATESGMILFLPYDQGSPRPISAERRRQQLASIEV